jgi:hypothetical protein
MKRSASFLLPLLIALLAVARADDTDANAPAPAKPLPPPGPVDEATVAHTGYQAARYEPLWTHSPFSVETPEDDTTQSAEYSLVGVAQIDGVSYANLVEKQNQNHFLISSDKTINGLMLTAVTHRGGDIYATITHNGEVLSLKLESGGGATAPVLPPPMPNGMPVSAMPNGLPPGIMPQNIPMPNANPMPATRPLIRIHRPTVRILGQPGQPAPPQPVPTPMPPPGQ